MVIVKLFAQVRELAGSSEIQLELPDDARAADIAPAIAARFPLVAPVMPSARIAINRAFADPDTPIRAGDEVAVIPPVSGG